MAVSKMSHMKPGKNPMLLVQTILLPEKKRKQNLLQYLDIYLEGKCFTYFYSNSCKTTKKNKFEPL